MYVAPFEAGQTMLDAESGAVVVVAFAETEIVLDGPLVVALPVMGAE